MMKGVSKNGVKFRAYYSFNGESCQTYFDNEAQAEEMVKLAEVFNALSRPVWAENNAKKADAKAKDLPVGFCDTYGTKTNRFNEVVKYPYIVCTHKFDGKLRHTRRSYGARRSRSDAILLLTQHMVDKFSKGEKDG